MKKITFLLFVLTALTIVNSCRRDKYIPNICFDTQILPIFVTKCSNTGCHNTTSKAGNIVLTSHEEILKYIVPYHANKGEVFASIKGKHPSMPPQADPQLTAIEIDLIRSWVNFGAPNTICSTSSPTTSSCDTTSNNTYTAKIKDIMDANCVGCHFTGNTTGHNLDTYSGVKASVNTGKLELAIKHLGSKPMPQSLPKLSPCTIAKIDKWISLGMPQ